MSTYLLFKSTSSEIFLTRSSCRKLLQGLDFLAFGACSLAPSFGDRFIELGAWRLAAMDESHFSISHRNGHTLALLRSDGHILDARSGDWNAWERPKAWHRWAYTPLSPWYALDSAQYMPPKPKL